MQSSVRGGLRVSIDNFHETFLTQRETLKLRGHMNRGKVVPDMSHPTHAIIDGVRLFHGQSTLTVNPVT